ncbi:MAG: ATP-binding protein [Candidatus Omnitrophica bacterium]|nr:ATP-binding protein [Candidatus Omnitrophota bacterium]MBU1851323.1 ATP-binding protein [Candidatus Omnitrophota bacterium]
MFSRSILGKVLKRLSEKRRFIQVLAGPRQTGKTTIASQTISRLETRSFYATADEPALKGSVWIEEMWQAARAKIKSKRGSAVLILDEAQKVPGWSETVKKLWDEDTLKGVQLKVVILGSSPLLVQKGLNESLAGRFEVLNVSHWSFDEMKTAFKWDVDKYIFFGGYPGGAALIKDKERWSSYIKESLIETSISRDILLLNRVDKPALLRRLFELGCNYSARILSYQKMLGQLQDAGNTVTLAHYLNLLEGAGLIAGLQKYAGEIVRQKSSSPKLLVLNTALISAQKPEGIVSVKKDPGEWGRLVESAIGAALANGIKGTGMKLYYWAGKNSEVDFVLVKGKEIIAIEVKSGRKKENMPGMENFAKEFDVYKKMLVGTGGMPVEDFLLTDPARLFV